MSGGLSKGRFRCWICGRFAKLLSATPYADDFGFWFHWRCSKCGDQGRGVVDSSRVAQPGLEGLRRSCDPQTDRKAGRPCS